MDRDVRARNVRCLPAGTIKRGGSVPFIWQTWQTANPISSPGLKGLKNGRGREGGTATKVRRKERRRKGGGGGEDGEEVRKREMEGGSITGQDGNR